MNADLLRAISEKRVAENLTFDGLTISSISIFELQAKAARLRVKSEYVMDAISSITKHFRVEPYYSPEVIKASFKLRETISDYIDCIIVATAIVLGDNLVSEDSKILRMKEVLLAEFGVNVLSYDDLVDRKLK